MKLTKLFSILTLVLGLSFGLNSCEDTTTTEPVVTVEKLAAPTNLMATSFDKESVILKWTLSTDETNANFKGYEIRYDGKLVSTGPTTGANTFTVSGLTEGEHVFSIKALTSDSTKKLNSDAITLTWAPAWRFTTNVNDEAIQLFETNSEYGSGLNLFDATGFKPKTLKVSSIADWTIGIETKTDGVIKFGPVASLNYTAATAKNVQISAPIPATGLNDLFDSQALSTKTFKAANGYEDLASLNSATGVIFVVKETIGSDVRYAKVFVKKATSGFLQGTAPNRNIEVEISYQNKLNTPYAK